MVLPMHSWHLQLQSVTVMATTFRLIHFQTASPRATAIDQLRPPPAGQLGSGPLPPDQAPQQRGQSPLPGQTKDDRGHGAARARPTPRPERGAEAGDPEIGTGRREDAQPRLGPRPQRGRDLQVPDDDQRLKDVYHALICDVCGFFIFQC